MKLSPKKYTSLVLAATVIIFLISVGLIYQHNGLMNGPPWFKWGWRSMPWTCNIFMLPGLIICIAGYLVYEKKRNIKIALSCFLIANIYMQIISVGTPPQSFSITNLNNRLIYKTINIHYNSQFNDAYIPDGPLDLLKNYEKYQTNEMKGHSVNKGPGMILFYMFFISLFEEKSSAALISALFILIISSLSIRALFTLAKVCSLGDKTAITAAAIFSMSPALTQLTPVFDTLYPILACTMLSAWILAIKKNDWRYSLLFASLLFISVMCTFALLVLGFIFVTAGFFYVDKKKQFVKQSLISAACFSTLFLLMKILFSFSIVQCFTTALKKESEFQEMLNRPYPNTIPYDLVDFALGSSFVIAILVLIFLLVPRLRHKKTVLLCALFVGQILVTTVTGLLRCETVRVWLFMQPFMMIPAALAMRKLPLHLKLIILVLIFCTSIAAFQNYWF
ncbi:MAG: hypothetical protein HRT89_21040 [Lentisphaeria bacterium]|nr:hypothetical protein [Lentisphaeria bacterium]NQZ70546.1 hypothetical protein [Lentisphaeria bacterium]